MVAAFGGKLSAQKDSQHKHEEAIAKTGLPPESGDGSKPESGDESKPESGDESKEDAPYKKPAANTKKSTKNSTKKSTAAKKEVGIDNVKKRKHIVEKPKVKTELAGKTKTDENNKGKVMRKPASIAMPMKKPASCKVALRFPGVPVAKTETMQHGDFRIYSDLTAHGWRVTKAGEHRDKKFSWRTDAKAAWAALCKYIA